MLFRVCLDDLEFPLFMYSPLDGIRLPSQIEQLDKSEAVNFNRLRVRRLSQSVADASWSSIGTHLKDMLGLEYVNDWPRLVLLGQQDEDADLENFLSNLETQDEPSGGLGSPIVSDTIEIHGVPVEIQVFSARRVQWGMSFVNVHAYEPLGGWSRWCNMRSSQFFKMMQIYSVPELQVRAARGQTQALLESFATRVFVSDLAKLDLRENLFQKVPALAGSTMYIQAELPQKKKESMLKACTTPLALNFAVGPDGAVSCQVLPDL